MLNTKTWVFKSFNIFIDFEGYRYVTARLRISVVLARIVAYIYGSWLGLRYLEIFSKSQLRKVKRYRAECTEQNLWNSRSAYQKGWKEPDIAHIAYFLSIPEFQTWATPAEVFRWYSYFPYLHVEFGYRACTIFYTCTFLSTYSTVSKLSPSLLYGQNIPRYRNQFSILSLGLGYPKHFKWLHY